MIPDHAEEVARLSPHRHLSRCPCGGGTYHLHWDAGTFRLTEDGVRHLVQKLAEVLHPDGSGTLWFGSVGLRLGPGEGWQLLYLLQEGLHHQLKTPESLAFWPRHMN